MTEATQDGRKHILVLWWCHDSCPPRHTIRQHLRVLSASRLDHDVCYHNVRYGIPTTLRLFPFDAIVLHTTLLGLRWSPRFLAFRRSLEWLASSPAVKIAMPQDEYDHAAVLDDWLAELNVDVVASIFNERVRGLLYPTMSRRASFLRCFTGYIDDTTAAALAPRLRPIAERPLDLVYRACKLPFWFGSHGQLKHEISEIFNEHAPRLGLRCDISTRDEDTIVTDDWFTFLSSSKATIGCESGSSVLDRRGEIQALVRKMQQSEPHLTFADVERRLPPEWNSHRFFAMGPRHLEAVITRTCQILVEGEYDGVLQPNRHYIPVRRDFANLDEVLHMVRDSRLLQSIADRAYDEIYLRDRNTYAAFAAALDARIAHSRVRPTSRRRWLYPVLRMNLWLHGGMSRCKQAVHRVLRPAYHLARRIWGRVANAVRPRIPSRVKRTA